MCACACVYVSTSPDSKITGLLCFTVVPRCPLRKLSLSTVYILEICDCPIFSAVLCSFVSLCGKISMELRFAPTNLIPAKMRWRGAKEMLVQKYKFGEVRNVGVTMVQLDVEDK